MERLRRKIQRATDRPDRLRVAALSRIATDERPIRARVALSVGGCMTVEFPERVSTNIAYEGDYEPEVTEMMRCVLKPDDVFFDVGAHFGLRTLQAHTMLQGKGRIVCFEPAPDTLEILKINCGHLDMVTIESFAISNSSGSGELLVLPTKFSASNSMEVPRIPHETLSTLQTRAITVPTITIDDYVSLSGLVPNLIKLDVENHESAAIDGARRTIEMFHPHIIMEVGDLGRSSGNSTDACLGQLTGFGYIVFAWDGSGLIARNNFDNEVQENILAIHRDFDGLQQQTSPVE